MSTKDNSLFQEWQSTRAFCRRKPSVNVVLGALLLKCKGSHCKEIK